MSDWQELDAYRGVDESNGFLADSETSVVDSREDGSHDRGRSRGSIDEVVLSLDGDDIIRTA